MFQLQLLYNKDQSLIELYFDEIIKHEGHNNSTDDNPVFKHIAQTNPIVFAKLFEKYKFNVELGYKTTIKFIDSLMSNVLDKLDVYLVILNRKAVVKKLGYKLKDMLFKPDPKNGYKKIWERYLQYYPKKQQFSLFRSSYDSTFYNKFGENIEVINHKMLKIITDPLEKEKLAKIKYEKENDQDYLKYVSPSYCLNEFKKKISQVSKYERERFVENVTTSCIRHEDLNYLLELCELLAVQFKKYGEVDDFFYEFQENLEILDKFTEEHWKYMMVIVAEAHGKETWSCNDRLIRIKYLEYLINNNKPIREFISKYSQWPESIEYSLNYKMKINRKVLCELIEIGHTKLHDERQSIHDDLLLVYLCKKFNDDNPEDAIDILQYPRFLQSFQNLFEKELDLDESEDTQNNAIKYLITRTESSEQLDELKGLYFKKIQKFGQMSICLWFLKHEPETFQKYLNDFLENFDKMSAGKYLKRIWYFMKAYSHLGLDKEVVEFCKLKLEKDRVLKKELIEALTILSPADSHLEFIKSYVPTTDKIETTDDDEIKNYYDLQCNLIKYLHLVRSPATVLPMALQFCKGDYLKFALSPLYSSMYKLPENEVVPVIEKLSQDEADSVKKHAVHLSCVILDTKTAYNYLEDPDLMPDLLSISKYFVRNPSELVWNLVESKLSDANINCLHIFKWVIEKSFPTTYKMKYIEALWTMLNENMKTKNLMFKKMELTVIQKLHPDFGYKIIKENIFQTEDANDLMIHILIHMNDANKYEFMKKIFHDLKENHYSTNVTKSRVLFHKFIKTLSENYFNTEVINEDFADNMFQAFSSVFSPSDAFEEYVSMKLLKLKGKDLENCAEICVEFNNALVLSHGRLIANVFAFTISQYVSCHLFENDNDKMKFLYFIWKVKKSTDDYLLIINLLPHDMKGYNWFKELYNDVLTDLEQVNHDYIRLKFNLYLNNLYYCCY